MRHSLAIIMLCFGAHLTAQSQDEDRIAALLAAMTLEEKIGQLNQYSNTFDLTGPAPEAGAQKVRLDQVRNGLVGSMLNVSGAAETRRVQEWNMQGSRLKIPMLFAYDVIHGYQTIFPIPLAEAASWDLQAIERSARVAAREASAAGLHWTFAPMVDISRDARWGRVMEGAGEDPYLGSLIAIARINGFQGSNLAAPDTIAACAKHFAGYGFAEAGRDYNTVDISNHTLHNVVLPPFRASVQAGVATIMNGFNEIGGIPVTADGHLQRTLLKGEWGFDGLVVSDWNSIGELVPHGVAQDLKSAALLAITAGSDVDMEGTAYLKHLAQLVRSGAVPEKLIDQAVTRVLRLKSKLGLFEDPYRYSDPQREKAEIYSKANQKAAREVAQKSIVLLKNQDLLPLKSGGTIAVIGPLANDKDSPLGSWRAKGVANSAVSLLEGIKTADPDATIHYAQGTALGRGERSFVKELEINHDDHSGIPEAVKAAQSADLVVMALGEEAFQSGEGRSQVDLGLKGPQMALLDAVLAVNKKVVVVLMNGRPLVLTELEARVPALVEAWHLGSQAGHAIADVLYGKVNPSGRLPMSFPRHVGQLPLYYAQKNTGRPGPRDDGMVFWSHYTDEKNTPLYPFGYGLSYTSFSYSDVSLDKNSIGFGDRVNLSVTIKNTGQRAGIETVQLYVRDLVGSVTRPIRELKAFRRVALEPGQSQKVTFALQAADLAFYTARRTWEAEPGEFQAFIGAHALDGGDGVRFTLTGTPQ